MNTEIINKIDKYINYSLEFNQNISINKLFAKKFKNEDLEYILNYYIKEIKKNSTIKKYNNILFIVNIIYNKCLYDIDLILKNEANIIADDLLEKIIKYDNLSIPININLLEEYAISSNIDKKSYELIVFLIVIKFSIVNFLLKTQI